MTFLTMMVLLATLAVVASLVTGIVSMANNGEIAHRKSEQWMVWRVAFQGLAFVLILLAISGWE
jgi:hypothetical protein